MDAKVNYIGKEKTIIQAGGEIEGRDVNITFMVSDGKVYGLWDVEWSNGDKLDVMFFEDGEKFEGLDEVLINEANKQLKLS